jgi:hypothetical protein
MSDRRFLRLCLLAATVLGSMVSAHAEPLLLAPQGRAGDTDRVSIEIEVGGKLTAQRTLPDGLAKPDTKTTSQTPLKVAGKLVYDQRLLAATPQVLLRSARYYHDTNVAITTGSIRTKPTLATERRLVVCEHGDTGVRLWSPAGVLASDESDLLSVAGNTLVCDQLLPVEPVKVGSTWQHSTGDVMILLGLDHIEKCRAESTLKEANSRYARAELEIDVTGMVDGAQTTQQVSGIYIADIKTGRITQLNLAIKESRQIGPVSPAFEGVAKLQIRIEPTTASKQLDDAAIAAIGDGPAERQLQRVTRHEPLGIELTHTDNWYVTASSKSSLTLRQIDESGLVANCTLVCPAVGRLEAESALPALKAEVTKSLGTGFKQFARESQWITPAGYRAVGVVTLGEVSGVAVEWHSYVVADDKGRRVSLSFTLESDAVERLGETDRALVDGLRLVPLQVASGAGPAAR